MSPCVILIEELKYFLVDAFSRFIILIFIKCLKFDLLAKVWIKIPNRVFFNNNNITCQMCKKVKSKL